MHIFFEIFGLHASIGIQNPSLGRKFHVEPDFQVKTSQFQRPEAKMLGKLTPDIWKTNLYIFFCCIFLAAARLAQKKYYLATRVQTSQRNSTSDKILEES